MDEGSLSIEVRKWEDMSTDCLAKIFERVGLEILILDVPLVCKSWYKASLNPQCWKVLDFQNISWERCIPPGPSNWRCNPQMLSTFIWSGYTPLMKIAVNRSRGMATEVMFPSICENILDYVLQRCMALKSLILPGPIFSFTGELQCVPKLINKWKGLESITLRSESFFKEIVSEIHTNCENFVALTMVGHVGTEEALAIGTFLSGIKKLVLSTSELPRENLLLILSGCRELELLDVTNCRGFDDGDTEILSRASHIKTFKSEGSTLDDKDLDDYEDLDDWVL